MTRHVVILGAGFAGLELSARLSEEVPDDVHVTLIDKNDSFFFGFSKLDVLFKGESSDAVQIPYASVARDGVEFHHASITSIDPEARRVETDSGSFDADVLVVALGADYDHDATPGFRDGGHEYYTMQGAERLRDVLPSITSGEVVIAVLGEPYKCPPAPFECALLLDAYFRERGVRDDITIRTMGYMGAPVPVDERVSGPILAALNERGIEFLPKRTVKRLDAEAKRAVFEDDESIPYDLFIGIPVHRVPKVVAASGLAPNGWIAVDVKNLATSFENVYALGDVAAANTAKAGVFAERAAIAVADDIIGKIRGTGPGKPFDGKGTCYLEFGDGLVAKVEADFLGGPSPQGALVGPSRELADEKAEFARSRRKRWFGID